jgi:hypothetical protein
VGRGCLRKILGAEDIRRLLEEHAPKQRWLHIQQLHDVLEPFFRDAAPGLAASNAAEFDARRMHDLRNLLQKDKNVGRIRWDRAAQAYFIPELDEETEEALLQPEPPARLRDITPEELARLHEAQRRVGRRGEELVSRHLARRKAAGNIKDYTWVADASADAPYDFEVVELDGGRTRVEVKTTEGPFGARFRLSYAQVAEMAKSGAFEIHRVHDLTPTGATLRVTRTVRKQAQRILEICEDLGNFRPAAFVVPPTEFDFGEPVPLV